MTKSNFYKSLATGRRIHMALVIAFTLIAFPSMIRGQTTTTELAKMVFSSFQTGDVSKLDTLMPTSTQIIEILKEKGLKTSETGLRKNFDEIYEHHKGKLKEKCLRFIQDTTFFNVDWHHAALDSSVAREETINLTTDSTQNSKRVTIVALDIHFSDGKKSFTILFKDIYNYRGIWKIGDNVKFKRDDEQQ